MWINIGLDYLIGITYDVIRCMIVESFWTSTVTLNALWCTKSMQECTPDRCYMIAPWSAEYSFHCIIEYSLNAQGGHQASCCNHRSCWSQLFINKMAVIVIIDRLLTVFFAVVVAAGYELTDVHLQVRIGIGKSTKIVYTANGLNFNISNCNTFFAYVMVPS